MASYDGLPSLCTPATVYPPLWKPQEKMETYKRICQLCIHRVQKWQMPPASHQVRCSMVPKTCNSPNVILHVYSIMDHGIFNCWYLY